MAVNDPSTAARIERLGMRLIQPQQGLQALQHALSSSSAVVAAVPFIWPTFLGRLRKGEAATTPGFWAAMDAEWPASKGVPDQSKKAASAASRTSKRGTGKPSDAAEIRQALQSKVRILSSWLSQDYCGP
jgi:hypothetical protein